MPTSRPRLVGLAVVGTALALAAALPSTASASTTTANQWAGGSLAPDRQSGASRYPATGALVSMTTSPTVARLVIRATNQSCDAGRTLRGTVTTGPGGTPELLVLGVEARRRIRTARVSMDYAVSLRPAAPGVLTGTASARGTFRDNGRRVRCRISRTVVLRSRAALAAPQRLPTDPALPRVGILGTTIAPRVRAAIAITRRADGFHHALWVMHLSCRSGRTRTSFDTLNFAPRFRVRPDGTFAGREDGRSRGRVTTGATKGARFSRTFRATIRGRIDPDGIARGSVRAVERYRESGGRTRVCRMAPASFAAAP